MSDPTLGLGERVERYEVLGLLGEGGLAKVYRVRHVQLGTIHALKLLTMRKAGLSTRLLLEGRIQAQLRHPNIVNVTDVVEHDGQPGLIIEFVEGPTLDDWLRDNGPPDVDECLHLFAQILAGVRAAHLVGVLHRDIKPANVLLQVLGGNQLGQVVPKVADFGIAKVAHEPGEAPGQTRAGSAMGTPGYMAPEQFNDAAGVDARADVFALGTLLYEMLTGQPAFAGPTVLDTLNAVAQGRYRPLPELAPDVPAHIVEAVARAVKPEPDERFPSCDAFAEAVFVDARDLRDLVIYAMPGGPVRLTNKEAPHERAAPQARTPAPLTPSPIGHEGTIGGGSATMVQSADTMMPGPDTIPAPRPGTATRVSKPPSKSRGAMIALGLIAVVALGGLVVIAGGTGVALYSGAGTTPAPPADVAVPEPASAAPELTAVQAPLAAVVTSSAPTPPATALQPVASPVATAPVTVPSPQPGAAPAPVPIVEAVITPVSAPEPIQVVPVSEPVPEAAVSIPSIKGTWTGRWNGRQLTLRIDGQTGGNVRARIEVLLGTTPRAYAASGTFDGTALTLTGANGLTMKGTLAGDTFTGTAGATDQKTGAWEAGR